MQKILLRITVLIVCIFGVAFLYSAYGYYRVIHSDDPIMPSASVETGSLTIVRGGLAIDMTSHDRYDLTEKDILITKENSFVTVTWPDRSETRLGSNSRMQIDTMKVATDYSHIEIEFGLEQGQAWSTVVRTIYPGSYFRTRIPGQGVIAGVRGTVYNIDIARGYIHSIDHSVSLSDKTGKSQNLLPGEIVSVNDIFRKLGREVLDTAWYGINQARDQVFLESQSAHLRQQIDILSGKSSDIWDRFVRWVLSFFPAFRDIADIEHLFHISTGVVDNMIPREQLFALYQKIQDKKFIQEREQLREYILQGSGALGFTEEQVQVFVRGAVWDSLMSSGVTLSSADKLISNYADQFDVQLRSVLQVIPIRDIETKSRETLRKLLK